MKQEGSHLVGGPQTRLPVTGTSDELHRADAEGNPEDRGTSPFRQFLAFVAEAGLAILVALAGDSTITSRVLPAVATWISSMRGMTGRDGGLTGEW